jgi:hypothetical protein
MSQVTYQLSMTVANTGGATYGQQLDHVVISVGASSALDQPQPATMEATFLGLPVIGGITQDVGWWLGKRVTVTVWGTREAAPTTCFVGTIQAAIAEAQDADGLINLITLNATSDLDLLNNMVIGTVGYPSQSEYDRIAAIEAELGKTLWSQLATTTQWDTVDAFYGTNVTWATFGDANFIPDLYCIPGTSYMLEEYLPAETTAFDYLQSLALGCSSWLIERFGGSSAAPQIWYEPFAQISGGTYASLDVTGAVVATSLHSAPSIIDVYNDVTYENSTLSGQTVIGSSANLYGRRPVTVVTSIASQGDLNTKAENKATGLQSPMAGVTSMTVNYDKLLYPDRMQNYQMTTPRCYSFSGLPAGYDSETDYQIRGMTLDISYLHAEANWVLLPRDTVEPLTTWFQVNAASTWNTYATATTQWTQIV